MESSTPLRHIPPPGKDRPAIAVAREIVALIRSDFSLNTKAICALLRCERQWVDTYIRPEVEHIFLTPYFQRFILDSVELEDDEKQCIQHGYYFYSARSLQKYWQTHASADRRTILIDLADHRAPGVSTSALREEYKLHAATRPSTKEKERHQAAMRQLLTEKGYALFRMSGEKTEWTPCPLPPLSDELPLVTLPTYRKRNDLGSNTSAVNKLIRNGAVRIKLGNRSLWLENQRRCVFPIAIQAGSAQNDST